MTSRRQLLRRQRAWAKAQGLAVDARGYLESVNANLRVPLSADARAAFESGGGSELLGHGGAPAKMHALHSSAALAVNVFDHWTPENAGPLLDALGIDGMLALPPRFEAPFPTGLPGTPPNLDVALTLTSGTIVGIESKFTEWMTRKRASHAAFKDKYFPSEAGLWARNGLPACQALAADMMSGAASFRHLDAAQLLKHALGLSTKHGGRFALYYVYHDVPGPAGVVHAQEVARFRERVGGELGFGASTYQDVYRKLAAARDAGSEYLGYLGSRYFPATAEPAAVPSDPYSTKDTSVRD